MGECFFLETVVVPSLLCIHKHSPSCGLTKIYMSIKSLIIPCGLFCVCLSFTDLFIFLVRVIHFYYFYIQLVTSCLFKACFNKTFHVSPFTYVLNSLLHFFIFLKHSIVVVSIFFSFLYKMDKSSGRDFKPRFPSLRFQVC